MKTSSWFTFAVLCCASFSTSTLAAEQPPAPEKQVPPAAADAAAPTPPSTGASVLPPATWEDIKGLPFEQRAEFSAGLKRLETKLEGQIAELKAKRAKVKTENKEWDFAMRNLDDTRTYLKSLVTEVNDTPSETWNDEKEKVFRAWQSAQDAYDRVKITTTQG